MTAPPVINSETEEATEAADDIAVWKDTQDAADRCTIDFQQLTDIEQASEANALLGSVNHNPDGANFPQRKGWFQWLYSSVLYILGFDTSEVDARQRQAL